MSVRKKRDNCEGQIQKNKYCMIQFANKGSIMLNLLLVIISIYFFLIKIINFVKKG